MDFASNGEILKVFIAEKTFTIDYLNLALAIIGWIKAIDYSIKNW